MTPSLRAKALVGRLRHAIEVVQLVRALPELLRLQAELEAATDQRVGELETRVIAQGQRLKQLHAITHELYIGPTTKEAKHGR
jgi:hypothetical protein